MLVFKKIRYKNFLSVGNTFIEIDLDKHNNTLIVGKNGSGKTTISTALSFVLFGKSNRNINKHLYVNSINKKDCLVEVDFTINSVNHYKVRRGIHPNIFEIYHNDSLVAQSSHNRDYQHLLETNILKMNFRTFNQIVVLGSSSFVPFMALPPWARREIVENILDISIFSKMNHIIKQQITHEKNNQKDLSYKIQIIDTKINSFKEHTNSYIKKLSQNIETINAEIESLQEKNKQLYEQIKQSKNYDQQLSDISTEYTKIVSTLNTFNHISKDSSKALQFLQNNSSCPTCLQEITEEFKKANIETHKSKVEQIDLAKKGIEIQINKIKQTMTSYEEEIQKVNTLKTQVYSNDNSISLHTRQLQNLKKELEKEIDLKSNEDKLNKEYRGATEEKKNKIKELHLCETNIQYKEIILDLLKDSGIKTKIIKHYLPLINSSVNEYLSELEFFAQFMLDEEFKETIRSRYYDEFSYESFSEGEKQRIDLALLFTWRKIAKVKNSINVNLLILDETFDSSLDLTGIDKLMTICQDMPKNYNLFVISHKGESIENKFAHHVEFQKPGNFSTIKFTST